MYYDRDGKPLADTMAWGKLFRDREYQRVARDTLPNGLLVSTVWLGMDHGFDDGPPIIFETMVFAAENDMDELDCIRYATEAEALFGHVEAVKKWTSVEKGQNSE